MYKDLLNSVPHHGFEPMQLVSFFYERITPTRHQFIDIICNGEFLSTEPEGVLDYFDSLVENTQSWDISDPTE